MNTGVASDGFKIYARTPMAQEWAKQFGFPREKSWMFSAWSDDLISVLSKAYTRKYSFYFDVYLESEKTAAAYRYPVPLPHCDVDDILEPILLDPRAAAQKAIDAVRALQPAP